MALQSSNTMLASEAFDAVRQNARGWKAQAQSALATLSGTVNSDFIFHMLDQLAGAINALNTWKAIANLNTYATGEGYPTTMVTDCTACATAAQACIDWVTTNFPASGGFLQSHVLNADGSRAPRTFTTAQTAGLQTALTNFIATIT